jgi:dienelactone hydrolase
MPDGNTARLRAQVAALEALARRLTKAGELMIVPDGFRTHQDAGQAGAEILRLLDNPHETHRRPYVRGC